jgi:hypothetical protein
VILSDCRRWGASGVRPPPYVQKIDEIDREILKIFEIDGGF